MFYGWRVVAGAFAALMMTGGFFTYAFSLLVNPIREEFGASLEQVMYSLTVGVLLGLAVGPVNGMLVDRYSVRVLMSVGAFLSAVCFFLMAQSNSILMFVVTTAVCMSLTQNLMGAVPGSAAVTRWFTANRGRALGVAAMGTSLGGIIYPMLIAWWIEAFGWRVALHCMALSTLLVILPLIWFNIRSYPRDMGMRPEGREDDDDIDAPHASAASSLGFADILRQPRFWLLGLSMGLVFSAFTTMLANLSPYASRLGIGEAGISTMIALLAVSGMVGKISFGMAADHIPPKYSLWMAHALLLTAFAILIAEPPYPLMLVASSCIGLCTGGLLPVWNALVAKMFGIASFGRAMGIMGPTITLCVLPGYAIVGRLFDSTGSYTAGLILYSGAILVAAVLMIPIKNPE